MCAQRGRQLDPQALYLLPRCQTASQATCWALSTRRPHRALYGSTSLLQHARCYQPSMGDRQGTLCPTKPDGQATAVCVHRSRLRRRSAYEGQDADLWWRTRAPGSPSRSPERCRQWSRAPRTFHVTAHCARASSVRHGQQLC